MTTKKESALSKVRLALSKNGLGIDSERDCPKLGFKNPERGYAIFVGEPIKEFIEEYNKIRDYSTPEGYCIPGNFLLGERTRYYHIAGEKRDILAKRILVKRAIKSLEIEVEEQREEHEGGNYIIDSYYKVCVAGTKIGLFIKNPRGSVFPAGF